MSGEKTISEKILSEHAHCDARAGDVVVCDVDLVLGTDASAPMAIDYFERMGGERIFDPARVMFALDHYAPPSSATTAAFHDRVRAFARRHGIEVHEVGAGISHQIAVERGRVLAGDLVIGADSHTVTAGALGAFATGVGSSDIAAAMITGRVWLRVPETIKVELRGKRATELTAKDIALALVTELGAEGANYETLELHGEALGTLSLEERLVLSNLAVEAGAKAAIIPHDDMTATYLSGRTDRQPLAVEPDRRARYARTIVVDLARLEPVVALPHAPSNVIALDEAIGTPIHMVFLGTCTGGRVSDFHAALAVLERGGSRIATGVQLVATPASREVYSCLLEDGTLAKLTDMGAVITTPGCGACCGTSGAIPGDDMNVLSTANRNFKARMGNPTASIYLASPEACAAAALTGRITDPTSIG
ncbi:MAG TPA: aconitase/3-isopropylmalate dehydratase large subunit family protein [Gemmatimonadaceae bacterium]|nr:aconitase/3-isopropylmalate dehydratase large subunit family protein [Gemmatimonadaceae bacterium]